jgi:hypothetical protein
MMVVSSTIENYYWQVKENGCTTSSMFVNGIAVGSIIALAAVGLTLTYGICDCLTLLTATL